MLWPSITQYYGVVVSDSAHSICESGLQRQEITHHPTVKCHDVNSRTHHPAIIYLRGIALYCEASYALAIPHLVLWGRGVRLSPLDLRSGLQRQEITHHPTVKCHDVNSRTQHPAIIYRRGIVLYCKALYALAIPHPVLWGRGVRLSPLDLRVRPSEARDHTSSHSEMPRREQ
jgi:hypothetical protein